MSLKLFHPSPTISCCSKTRTLRKTSSVIQHLEPNTSKSRRAIVASMLSSIALMNLDGKSAIGLDFGIMAAEQTMEEAQSVIREHVSSLLEVKALIDSESWKEARTMARKRASFLKTDLYTIIQASAKSERTQLRKLYFDLFNNVSQLDFAARDNDASRVRHCYDNIVIALNDILSRI